MAKELDYKDVNKEDYFTYYFSTREKINEELKNYKTTEPYYFATS